jgi:hypothetical protein
MRVPEKLLASAKNIQDWYNARAKRTNWADAKSINELKTAFDARLKEWMDDERIDRMTAASALWRVAHSSRSGDASGASVFIGFYDECLKIVAEKPGLKGSLRTVVTGIHYQVPGLREATLEGEIVDVAVNIRGKRVIRKALVAQVDGQLQPQDPQFPANMIGIIAVNADQPQNGTYTISIKQTSQSAWTATLI